MVGRLSAIVPALLCAGAVVLSFLCLFAGDKKNWMENYHMLTLNTSRIGENILNDTSSNSNNPISSLFHNITNSIENDINNEVGDLAKDLGLEGFYSVHMLDYCWGDYVPQSVANATVKSSAIHKNVSACSNRTAMFTFDPTAALQRSLNESGVDITLGDLDWPSDIENGIKALHVLQKAYFILFCIAIGLMGVAFITSLIALIPSGRLTACINIMVSALAFVAIGLASALVTAVIVKGAHVINKYGKDIGVEAHRGGKFLALTWAATGLMFLTIIWWCAECCIGHRKKNKQAYVKHG